MAEENNKNNFKVTLSKDSHGLNFRVITKVETQLGYLQVLEYIIQDFSYLHVVQWHFNNILDENTLVPKMNCKSFYREKDNALKLAYKVGKLLLQQY